MAVGATLVVALLGLRNAWMLCTPPGAGTRPAPTILPIFNLERWRAARAGGDGNGHSKANANKHVLVGGVDQAGDDAHHLAVAVKERAAGIAGIDGGIKLDQSMQRLAPTLGLEGAVQAGNDARGERLGNPERAAYDDGLVANLQCLRDAQGGRDENRRELQHAEDGDVVLRLLAADDRRRVCAIHKIDLNLRGAGDHVEAGEDGHNTLS